MYALAAAARQPELRGRCRNQIVGEEVSQCGRHGVDERPMVVALGIKGRDWAPGFSRVLVVKLEQANAEIEAPLPNGEACEATSGPSRVHVEPYRPAAACCREGRHQAAYRTTNNIQRHPRKAAYRHQTSEI